MMAGSLEPYSSVSRPATHIFYMLAVDQVHVEHAVVLPHGLHALVLVDPCEAVRGVTAVAGVELIALALLELEMEYFQNQQLQRQAA